MPPKAEKKKVVFTGVEGDAPEEKTEQYTSTTNTTETTRTVTVTSEDTGSSKRVAKAKKTKEKKKKRQKSKISTSTKSTKSTKSSKSKSGKMDIVTSSSLARRESRKFSRGSKHTLSIDMSSTTSAEHAVVEPTPSSYLEQVLKEMKDYQVFDPNPLMQSVIEEAHQRAEREAREAEEEERRRQEELARAEEEAKLRALQKPKKKKKRDKTPKKKKEKKAPPTRMKTPEIKKPPKEKEVLASESAPETEIETTPTEQLREYSIVYPKFPCDIPAAFHNYFGHKVGVGGMQDFEKDRSRKQQFSDPERETRLQNISLQQKELMDVIAFCLDMPYNEIEAGYVDFAEHVELIESLFQKGGRKSLFFSVHNYPKPTFQDAKEGKTDKYVQRQQEKKHRVIVSSGFDKRNFENGVVMVYRIKNNFQFDQRSFPDEYYFVTFKLNPHTPNQLSGIFHYLEKIAYPNVKATSDWGELMKSYNGPWQKRNFLLTLNDFVNFLSKSQKDCDNCIMFHVDPEIVEEVMGSPEGVKKAVEKDELLDKLEVEVMRWLSKLEAATVLSEKLRSESGLVTPNVELGYWRYILTMFDGILAFSQSTECAAYVRPLKKVQSSVAAQWEPRINQCRLIRQEAFENVSYFNILRDYWERLSKTYPPDTALYLPGFLYGFKQMFLYSRYYNTTNKAGQFIKKITNLMLKVCLNFITDDNQHSIWTMKKSDVISKINECLLFYEKYVLIYDDCVQQMIAHPEETPFGCSKMFVFGKFESFKKRLLKIVDLILSRIQYSILDSSKIEGIDIFSRHIKDFYNYMTEQRYDPLDHREPRFDADYDDYLKKLGNEEQALQRFMITTLDTMPSMTSWIHMLNRFEKINLACFNFEEAIYNVLFLYLDEMERVRDIYNKFRDKPILPRIMPPMSARIMWIKSLTARIENPMLIFKKYRSSNLPLLTQKTTIYYNSLMETFIFYEMLHQKAVFKKYYAIEKALNNPLLLYNKKDGFQINFHPCIRELLMELKHFCKFGLKITDLQKMHLLFKDEMLYGHEHLRDLMKKYGEIISNVPHLFCNLVKPLLINLEKCFEPCLKKLMWTSLGLNRTLNKIANILDSAERFIKEANDIKETRIDASLSCIENMSFIFLTTEVHDHHKLLRQNLGLQQRILDVLQIRSENLEVTVLDLINRFVSKAEIKQIDPVKRYYWYHSNKIIIKSSSVTDVLVTPDVIKARPTIPTTDQYREDCMELFNYFNQRRVEAMSKATKNSLETLISRVPRHGTKKIKPMFTTSIVLQKPNIIIKPSMDEMQTTVNKIVAGVLRVSRDLRPWGYHHLLPGKFRGNTLANLNFGEVKETEIFQTGLIEQADHRITEMPEITDEEVDLPALSQSQTQVFDKRGRPLVSLYRAVNTNKDVVRQVVSLQSIFHTVAPELEEKLKHLYMFEQLWLEDKKVRIARFLRRKPASCHVREKFVEYDKLEERINALPTQVDVMPLEITFDNFNNALLNEVQHWRETLGDGLKIDFRKRADDLSAFLMEHIAVLEKPVKDLASVRIAMACLEDIRNNFVEIDQELDLIEDVYSILSRYDIEIPLEDMEITYSLRPNFKRMQKTALQLQELLCSLQEPMRRELLRGVAKFQKEVDDFEVEFDVNGPMVEGIPAKEASDRVLLFQDHFDQLWDKYLTFSSGERLFGLPVKEYPTLIAKKKQFNLLTKLYGLYLLVNKTIDGYFTIPWAKLNIEKINDELLDYQNRCRKLPKGMKEWPAFKELKKKIDDFNESCPLLEMMLNKAMKDRHWERLEALLNVKFEVDSYDFTLGHVMETKLLDHKFEVEDICVSAIKEKEIEAKLGQVQAEWKNVKLEFAHFKNKGELLIKGAETMEIIASLEDSMMVLNSLASNRFNKPFKKEIQQWVYNLSTTGEVLEMWLMVQNLWIYLEAVFVGGDIAKQMPTEAKRFGTIDRMWVKIMLRAREIVKVIDVCVGDSTMTTTLPYLAEQLELCQKSLVGYLEQKRLMFPRFFFVSDPVLLEILGQASDSHTIQPHLLSVFENIAKVAFSPKEYDRIISMISKEGEEVTLDRSIMAQGGVEHWLGLLLKISTASVGSIIANCWDFMNDPEFRVLKMQTRFVAQVGLLGLQMLWTRECERAFREWKWRPGIMKKTNRYFLAILNLLIDQTTRDLSKYDRVKYETLVTIHVHQRDIFDDLVQREIRNRRDFEWQKQERFYFHEEMEYCIVKITDVEFIYQNEFMGCSDRLVITPLTDRCYITLAQAVGMSMGGAPAGPAGTGKTETTKDMGKSLGKYVVVFNCSDQMDFRGLGRIFKGLAQSGSWGCFDEFNRIELPVLSVAAQQICICLMAKREKKPWFIFSDGDKVNVNMEFGIFITMNPGYAGRQELPENLKIMFRSVAMMVPDRHIIIRVKLASCGFRENIDLSRKFYVLYQLCEEQLSKQVHYDFGLRNILSVLRTMGAQKRSNKNDSEEVVLMRVLRDMNLSKLADEDEPLFMALIEDLFVGLKLTFSTYKDLQAGILQTCQKQILTNWPSWNLKIVQLYETSLVRHGLMTMGPTGSGKTTCIKVLCTAFGHIGRPHKEMRMNPKAITAPQMFGRLDVATNDWTDGIFSTLWRRSHKIKPDENVWIVLDGPVDAVWIENLNSVLDDNKTLTLANGDRIVMAPNSKLVFEPDNVDNASPATVSRMGMVYLSSSVLPWMPIMDGWLKKRRTIESKTWKPLFDKIYDDALTFVQTKLKAKMKILDALYIRQTCDLLDGLVPAITKEESENPVELTEGMLEKYFLFALMWSLGCVLELEEKKKLETFFLDHKSKLSWPECKGELTIFEFLVDEDGTWMNWLMRVEEYNYPEKYVPEYASILVPNVDNVRMTFLIHTIAKQHKGVLLIGEQGTAKTVMIKGYMQSYNPEEHLKKSLNFSSATTPNMVQRIVESYVDKRVGMTYGPSNNRKMTVFIDDINMPVINAWGDQITNEIVRQLMEMKGFYSLEKPGDFVTIQDIQLIGAMIHPGGGRNDIPHRLKRQFNIFNCTLPSMNSMDKIFGVLGKGYFCASRFKPEIVAFIPKLVPLTRILWTKTKSKMLPTPAKFHYVFNLRDLSRIWEGMLTIQDPELPNLEVLMHLWKHECTRVIADRFVSADDHKWFQITMVKVVHDVLLNPIMEELRQKAEKEEDIVAPFKFDSTETYFVDFLRDMPEPTGDEPSDEPLTTPKIYEEVPSWEFLKEKLLQYMESFNEVVRGSKMDLVFFHDAMVHLMIISRIIRTPRGSAILVGVGGSGKQSLTKLASFIAEYKYHQIILTRIYNVQNFMDDLKYLYRTAGAQLQGISFIFTDNEIKDEAFLEYLNNILSAGEVANLFAKDELDEITSDLVPAFKKKYPRKAATNDNLYDFFISQSRRNLHICLCFSPVSEKFRSRAMKFPGLISGCTMDWFSRWPRDALVAVSQHFLGNFPIITTPATKQALIELMGQVQDQVADACIDYYDRFRRKSYVTPKSFLAFLVAYKEIYSKRHAHIEKLTLQMSNGLLKLAEAAEGVALLKKELEENEREIAEANAAAELILLEVTEAAKQAAKVQAEVRLKMERANELVKQIAKDKIEAERRLLKAKPALDAAAAALLTIKQADIATVRKLGSPPYLITVIMDAVCILFNKKINYPLKINPDKGFIVPNWGEAFKVMAEVKFLDNLLTFPKDNLTGETIDLLIPHYRYPNFNFEMAKQACGNVAGLLKWVVAMGQFYNINKDVLPLKANLKMLEGRLDRAKAELAKAEALLAEKERELRAVQELAAAALKTKRDLQAKADRCKKKMQAATDLISGLAGEQIRWTQQLILFKQEIERLIGDVLLLSGFLCYTGPFNQEYRLNMQNQWYDELLNLKIPVTKNIDYVDCLVDAAIIGEWNIDGLPNDELSIQNGIIVTQASRYPLLIDPQSQGITWIKNKESKHDLMVTTLKHKYFRQHLEDALALGKPLLIEDIFEELDPILDNVLEKNYIKIGTSIKVKLSDKECDVVPGFRLYITTKLANPSYSPEISARTSVIDFTVTLKGLEDQLLGRVILKEKCELETERTNLVKDVTYMKRKMIELEANLLNKLNSVKGSLVDDETVIEVLNITKDTAATVQQKLNIASETEKKINLAREEYRPVAKRGSVLYFLVVEMSLVNCMYQTSLVQFLERFDLSMNMAEQNVFVGKRIQAIIDYFTYDIFKYKSRGLYETHKFLFVLLMALKIDLSGGNITHKEFHTFIKGGAALDLNAVPPKPHFKWITDTTWLNIVQLTEIPTFTFLINQITHNEKAWKQWFEKEAPEEEILPEDYEKRDIFKKVLLIRTMCPDRIFAQCKKYIASSLGEPYTEAVILKINTLIDESRPNTPMVCFLSMGSDPTPLIETTSKKYEMKLHPLSMGQGQEVHARKIMSWCMTEGGWVLLQNCHLGLDYMAEIFILLTETKEFEPSFRLWLTTEVNEKFPINLLQISLKYTNEPPQGMKAGLLRTYSSMPQETLDYTHLKQYHPLIYAISFMHTVVQERRKFGPLGWNIPYEFNFSDWNASILFIQNHLDSMDKTVGVDWACVRYMIGEVMYGGRVTDDYDKRLLLTFTRVWLKQALFEDKFMFYPGYGVMKYKNTSEYVNAISKMSSADPPPVYGLHNNANITFQTNSITAVLDTILNIQPKESGGGGGETRESVVGKLADEMLHKVPKNYDPYEVKARLKEMGAINPMNIFLRQEIDRIQKVISLVRTTLIDLELAIEGTIIMNEALRDALDNLYDARVPASWSKVSWVSSSIGFWFTEFLERNHQFSTWIYNGRPITFWMSGFFNPQGFLTSMKQEVARAHKGWALDFVSHHNSVLKVDKDGLKNPPSEGVYVYGLFLEGAGWELRNDRLTEAVPKVLYAEMPVIHIFAINTLAAKDPELYQCPVYKKPRRTGLNFIVPLWLECKYTPDHWIMRGVALLCDVK
ncbi:dynein heavy chain 8, axonemal isoform X2 [Cimex lectularius]|uniref:AAA+ ATPase domain-containing protein n=1 Tax=Cimex lectularius TaxID=79782 RepID=A0A8I6RYF0_CIMLE|nr:dynein heavy chain 8, axonemal isoform X2 [Cimex lectularius]